MEARERVKRTLEFRETDRTPFGIFGSNPWDEERLTRDLGLHSITQMYKKLDLDIWHLFQPLQYTGPKRTFKGKEADFWGVPLDIRNFGDSSIYNPLAEISSVDEVEEYCFPNIADFDGTWLDQQLDQLDQFAIEGGLWAPIFHNVTWLCGFENTLCDLVSNPEIVRALLRKVTDFWIDYTRKTLEIANGRIMIMQNCNDFGTQRELIMSSEMFRSYFKPELKRLYDTIKSYDVAVLQHSCGAIGTILEDFVEMGADIINPIQVSADGMDLKTIRGKLGGKVVVYGGIDTQYVLPRGTKMEIAEAVHGALDEFQSVGGYILAPSQGIEPDISTQNVQYMFSEAKKYQKIMKG
ncbi:MAG: uroporphyrinogen decarboxylase family protein [Lachnospiraceae bacterium]